MPFNAPVALLRTHQPLIQHLEKELGRPIVVRSSSDYYTFVNQLLDGQFDIAIAGPHFASMAQTKGWVILVRYRADLQPVLVVREGGPISEIDDLRGKRIGLSSPLSMSSIGGVKWLLDQGLKMGSDFQLHEYPSHGAAIAAVTAGEVEAALTTHTPIRQVPEDVRRRIRIMATEIHMPHLMTLAATRLGTPEVARVRTALDKFPSTPAGETFFRDTGYLGYADVTASDLKALRPFVDLTLQMMRPIR